MGFARSGKRPMYVEFYRREGDRKWDWRIHTVNRNIIATSGGQGYNSRRGAESSFTSIKNAILDGRIKSWRFRN